MLLTNLTITVPTVTDCNGRTVTGTRRVAAAKVGTSYAGTSGAKVHVVTVTEYVRNGKPDLDSRGRVQQYVIGVCRANRTKAVILPDVSDTAAVTCEKCLRWLNG
jgi:hypothetical protein